MKCPHCLDSFHSNLQSKGIDFDKEYYWSVKWEKCPACNKNIIYLCQHNPQSPVQILKSFLVYPKTISRQPLSELIPNTFAQDYKESCLVLSDSPKASAALGRRCLQNLLREKSCVKKANLEKEIEEVLASKQLPSYLAEGIDAVRQLGNFAAHPIKSTNTGEIVDVEPGEAEWILDVLEGLFDFYFVHPKLLKAKRDELNKKLTDAGKPTLK